MLHNKLRKVSKNSHNNSDDIKSIILTFKLKISFLVWEGERKEGEITQ